MHKTVNIDLEKIKAVIFDLDGTIVNNMPFQAKAWVSFASKYSKQLTEDTFHKKYSGLRGDAIFEALFQKELTLEEIELYRKERGSIYRDIFEKEMREVEGLTILLQKMQDKGITLALATTASKVNRDFILDKLKIRKFFKVIVGGEHVKNGKPDPEIYNLAVSKLGVNADKCIAFEDSLVGIQSALLAGVKVIGVLTSQKKVDIEGLFGVIDDFNQIEIHRNH